MPFEGGGGSGWPKTDAKARVYMAGDQLDIVSGVVTKILVDTIDYDPSGLYVDNSLIGKIPGFYMMYGGVRWKEGTVVAAKRWMGMIKINEAERSEDARHSTNTSTVSCKPFDILHLNADDVVELFCWHNAGVDTPDIRGQIRWTYLGIHLFSAD